MVSGSGTRLTVSLENESVLLHVRFDSSVKKGQGSHCGLPSLSCKFLLYDSRLTKISSTLKIFPICDLPSLFICNNSALMPFPAMLALLHHSCDRLDASGTMEFYEVAALKCFN